jgi:hypothetical protein
MRRMRDVREYKNALKRKSIEEQRKKLQTEVNNRSRKARERVMQKNAQRLGTNRSVNRTHLSESPLEISFTPFDSYSYLSNTKIRVCHVIDSLGIGGGQTMMMELVRALDAYYGENVVNFVVCPKMGHIRYDKTFFNSYGITPIVFKERDLKFFLGDNQINIMLQHRLVASKCLKHYVPAGCKYVLMSHTYNQLDRVSDFRLCDFYVSVCDFLHEKTKWSEAIHPTRRISVLNGVENNYLNDIASYPLEGDFKTGRCHRLATGKFKLDSLDWMEDKVRMILPGHKHYLLGHNKQAETICSKSKSCHYFGEMLNRGVKMSIIKALDVYFYETSQQEGASIAVLESLACGVPVLCQNFGGNRELVKDGVNGYIVKDRKGFLARMTELSSDPDRLKALKQSTLTDFNNRLHVKHTACKYVQIFDRLING